jgi:NAD(P)-dependent dehydrogenase (short-subunit alcohol dehydrogenase family)
VKAIVTGAARGIGASVAKALMSNGWQVACLDVREDLGRTVAASGDARFYRCDVSDKDLVDKVFSEAAEWLGSLDLLVAAAGLDKPGFSPEEIPESAWDIVMAVNAKGTFLTNQLAFRAMRQHGGAIINFTSLAGIRGTAERAAYSAAKAAVAGWTRASAEAWGPHGVTVNAIAPTVRTEVAEKFLERLEPEQRAAFESERARITPLGRLGEVEKDLLPLILLLAGPGGRYITGQTISVDGGRTMLGS